MITWPSGSQAEFKCRPLCLPRIPRHLDWVPLALPFPLMPCLAWEGLYIQNAGWSEKVPQRFLLMILPASSLQAQHLEGWHFWGVMDVSIHWYSACLLRTGALWIDGVFGTLDRCTVSADVNTFSLAQVSTSRAVLGSRAGRCEQQLEGV